MTMLTDDTVLRKALRMVETTVVITDPYGGKHDVAQLEFVEDDRGFDEALAVRAKLMAYANLMAYAEKVAADGVQLAKTARRLRVQLWLLRGFRLVLKTLGSRRVCIAWMLTTLINAAW